MILGKDCESKISCIYNAELKGKEEKQKTGKYSNKLGSVWNNRINRGMENWMEHKYSVRDYDGVLGKEIIEN